MATAKLNAELLSERCSLANEASALESKARQLRKRVGEIDALAVKELEKSGKASVKRCGFLLAWVDGRKQLDYRGELITRLGVDVVNGLIAKLKPPRKLQITPPAE